MVSEPTPRLRAPTVAGLKSLNLSYAGNDL
jgi:hypothetical protein